MLIPTCSLINSRTAVAGAIIGLLLVFYFISSRFLLQSFDVTTTSNLLLCSFVHAISKCVREVIFRS